MPPRLRKFVLAIHLMCSVGWFGAVVAYLALDITVATSRDPQLVRAAWMAMGLVTSAAIVPLALASLVTGLVMSLGTKWGLFRHWWVLISFLLTVFATVVLLSEAGLIRQMADVAADPGTPDADLLALAPTLPHSVGGLVVLLVVQVLNVFKPQGLTPYGWRKQEQERLPLQRRKEDAHRTSATLTSCADTCTACADACLGEENVSDLRRCIRLNLDCGDSCRTTADILLRQTDPDVQVLGATLEACALACRSCGEECERHAEMHEHCRVCAEACRRCEDACQRALQALGSGASSSG